MDDLLSDFLTESNENIAALDQDVVSLEQNPNNPELLSNIFRTMHTIKGTCGFIGLPRLEKVAHAGENILGKIRDGEMVATPAVITLVLECLDRIKWLMGELEAKGSEPEGDDAELTGRLNAAASGETPAAAVGDIFASEAVPEVAPVAETPAERVADEEEDVEEAIVSAPVPASAVVPSKAPAAPAPAPLETGEAKESAIAGKSIRVHVDLLENLMTMVSELVLTRNQLLQMLRDVEDSPFTTPLQRLNYITSELQDGVMKTRMQPIGNAWSKLPRLVRDLTMDLGKKIDLEMHGAETELDRQVLELIKDPLTHMVRNSCDHGLEMPKDRLAVGKAETGKIMLNAYHEGGHIIIEIKDDGRGLNLARIKEKCVSQGLVSEAELGNLTDKQIQQFIFRAGFSTAAAVTNVSGRGVGMDVVRSNIEKIGGTIDLDSTEGKGTRVQIKIPLTLAIISALIVDVSNERFAIPQISVVELVRTAPDGTHQIEYIHDSPFLRLRDRLLPLVALSELFRFEKHEDAVPLDAQEHFIVVAQVGTMVFGMIVDHVFETQEIVVKPSAPILRQIPVFSGNTILGDGSVVMILDLNGIANAIGQVGSHNQQDEDLTHFHGGTGPKTTSLLLFTAGSDVPKAVPLALIARLEEIDIAQIEVSNHQRLVQYRGTLMPLIFIDDTQKIVEEGRQQVLVFSEKDKYIGLVVDKIIDIVEEVLDVQMPADLNGSFGSAVIVGKTTEVLDMDALIHHGNAAWFHDGPFKSDNKAKFHGHILVVDDSLFYRNLILPALEVEGFKVTTCTNPSEALLMHEAGAEFDLIISDIEMPEMNGFEFASRRAELSRWADIPWVALSSHATQEDIEHGREAGFSDYVSKDDRDGLMRVVHGLLKRSGRAAA